MTALFPATAAHNGIQQKNVIQAKTQYCPGKNEASSAIELQRRAQAHVLVSADSTFVTPAEAGVQTEKTRDLRALPGSRPTPTTVREKN